MFDSKVLDEFGILHLAAGMEDNADLIYDLLDLKADPTIPDENGDRPEDIAAANEFGLIYDILKRKREQIEADESSDDDEEQESASDEERPRKLARSCSSDDDSSDEEEDSDEEEKRNSGTAKFDGCNFWHFVTCYFVDMHLCVNKITCCNKCQKFHPRSIINRNRKIQ